MDNENKVEGVTTEENNTGEGGSDVEMISVPKAEYDKTLSTLGSLKRDIKDLRKPKESVEEKTDSKSNDLGEKAFLSVNGIKTPAEIAFFNKMKKETGKEADSLIESTYFQSEFREFREQEASKEATPTGSKRSNNSQVDSVDYWLAKDELPPASERELRQKVVSARMAKEQSKGVFYNS